MAKHMYSNGAVSNLVATISGGATTITVAAGFDFPQDGPFDIRVDDEYMRVTSVAGSQFTVIRATEGSSPAGHEVGVNVYQVLTVDGLYSLCSQSKDGEEVAHRRGLNFLDGDGIKVTVSDDPASDNCEVLIALDEAQPTVACLYVATAEVTVTGTTPASIVPTGVGTLTLPENYLRPGRVIRFSLMGTATTDAARTGTLRVIFDAEVVLLATVYLGSATPTLGWRLTLDVVCVTSGLGGSVAAAGFFATASNAAGPSTSPDSTLFGTSTALDLDQEVTIGLTWAVGGDGTKSLTVKSMTVEIVN